MKTLSLSFLIPFLLFSCANHGQLKYVTKLPKSLKENSGIATFRERSAWFVEDSGNSDNIYKVDFQGNIRKELDVKNVKNRDWEDLATDKMGNLYIGDFGNNGNRRKDLTIYKLPNPESEPGDKIDAEKITFYYPEQKDFPPKKNQRMFDAEAFFHYDGYLYIFTKNRASPFTGESLIYRVPDKKGSYKAESLGKIRTCTDWETCQVTSADISSDGLSIVLLGSGKLWILTHFDFDNFSKATIEEIDLGVRTQLESVCFVDDKTLLLSDEENSSGGGNLYSYQFQ
ncbi:hypothetical protein [Pareuzebyella sediminis]|uniref:hypothetical protein n=1 Tax=Pareuzebyella sediminis TaxID=2607998 RepID=UPI0011EFA568|nr:hypothetical protein [Pareuzebyella sediminis]